MKQYDQEARRKRCIEIAQTMNRDFNTQKHNMIVSEMLYERSLFYAVHLENTIPDRFNSVLCATEYQARLMANLLNLTEGKTVRFLAEEKANEQINWGR